MARARNVNFMFIGPKFNHLNRMDTVEYSVQFYKVKDQIKGKLICFKGWPLIQCMFTAGCENSPFIISHAVSLFQ